MSLYFMNDQIFMEGKKMPPSKVVLTDVIPNKNGQTAYCYDKEGNSYTIELSKIFEDCK